MPQRCRDAALMTSLALAGLLFLPQQATGAEPLKMLSARAEHFGRLPDGRSVTRYKLAHGERLQVDVMTFGATVIGVRFPDRQGRSAELTLHLDSLADYVKGHPLFGSLVGRYANRIAGAEFAMDGRRWRLTANAGPNHIHGGKVGFQKQVWQGEIVRESHRVGVMLRHVSPAGDEGYPGRLSARVLYAVTDDDQLIMEYWATTDAPTHVNLTNHAYWNLDGAGSGDVLDHRVMIPSDHYVVTTRTRFPTGQIRSVEGTPYDFRSPRTIGARVHQTGIDNYDDCYVVKKQLDHDLALAAQVSGPLSGRRMEVYTTQPGIQFYTAKGLRRRGAEDIEYKPYYGFCLETQHFPDSPNQPGFPSTLLKPGETFHQITRIQFSNTSQ